MATDPMLDLTQDYSINRFTGSGTNGPFEFNFAGGYIRKEHVKAYITNEDTSYTLRTLTFTGPTTVTTDEVIPTGVILTIYRDTPKDGPAVDFTDGAIINEVNLDTLADQAVFVAAEVIDRQAQISVTFDSVIEVAAGYASDASSSATAAEASADAAATSASDLDEAVAATAADRTAVHADKLAADADAAATAADRTAVHSDKTSVDASVTAAATSASNSASSATAASTSATSAASSATAAAASATSVATTMIGTAVGIASITVSSLFQAFTTTGYAAAGDLGHGTYKRVGSMPAHPAYIQDAASAYFELLPGPRGINVKSLGAKSDSSTVNDTAFNNLGTVCKYLNVPGYIPGAAGTYMIQTSRDWTFTGSSGRPQYKLVGDGPYLSMLDVTGFNENYPVIDFSGNAFGEIEGIGVTSTANTCQASCMVLLGKNTHAGTGNGVRIRNSVFNFPTTNYHANNYAAVVSASCDLMTAEDVLCYGPRAWRTGDSLPAGVTSKFFTPNTTIDNTKVTLNNCFGIGSLGAAWEIAGGSSVNATGGFFTVITNGATPSGCIFKVVKTSRLNFKQVRTENEAGTTGMVIFQLDVDNQDWLLDGEFNSDLTGHVFGGTGMLQGCQFNAAQAAATPLFTSGFVFQHFNIKTETAYNIGAPSSTSYGFVSDGGSLDISTLQTAGITKHVEVRRNDSTHKYIADRYVQKRGVGSLDMQENATLSFAAPALTAYTGGSGEQTVYSWTIPANMLTNSQDLGGRITNSMYFKVFGETSSAHVALSSRVRFTLTDGTNSVDLFDSNDKPLSTNGFAECTLEFWLFQHSTTNGLRAQIEGFIQGARWKNRVTVGSTITTSAVDLTINVRVTNTGSSPFGITDIYARWG